LASHHSPLAQSAELTPGDTVVTTAIGANTMAATETRRQTFFHIAHLAIAQITDSGAPANVNLATLCRRVAS